MVGLMNSNRQGYSTPEDQQQSYGNSQKMGAGRLMDNRPMSKLPIDNLNNG